MISLPAPVGLFYSKPVLKMTKGIAPLECAVPKGVLEGCESNEVSLKSGFYLIFFEFLD